MATILVVDDDPVSQRLLGYALTRAGHAVVAAANGREALRLMGQQRPDLLILDLAMPEMDGVTMLRHLRDSADYRELPVIMLTASGLDSDARAARAAGVTDFLTKPLHPTDLAARVQRLLGPE
jgi:CheY-like chemotaxis protein